MNDILDEILRQEIEDGTLRFEDAPGWNACSTELNKQLDQLESLLDIPAHNALFHAIFDCMGIQQLVCFRHGFRLAFRLLGEGLSGRV